MTFYLEDRLLRRAQLGNLRQLQLTAKLVDFSSNDYLGLARSADLALFLEEGEKRVGSLNGYGSTGSRLLTGNTAYAQELENRIAQFHGYEAGVLFSCGYMANVGLLSTVACNKDAIFFDSKVHASTHDGIRLSRAKAFCFKHNDLQHLENRLKNCSVKGNKFICIESIYSTNGSMAPLVEVCLLAKTYDASVIVDEAHAVGVCGPLGRGLVAELNLQSQIFAQVATFGKALGTYGAIVLGGSFLQQALINFATSYINTTALPLHCLAAINRSYDLFPELEYERQSLRKVIHFFRSTYPHSSPTHIQSIQITGNEAVKDAANRLNRNGFDVRPLMSPTVRRGSEVLRICLHAFNTAGELSTLLEHIESNRNSYE